MALALEVVKTNLAAQVPGMVGERELRNGQLSACVVALQHVVEGSTMVALQLGCATLAPGHSEPARHLREGVVVHEVHWQGVYSRYIGVTGNVSQHDVSRAAWHTQGCAAATTAIL